MLCRCWAAGDWIIIRMYVWGELTLRRSGSGSRRRSRSTMSSSRSRSRRRRRGALGAGRKNQYAKTVLTPESLLTITRP